MTPVGAAPVHVFVSPVGNRFMHDIAGWVVEAARCGGRQALLVDDGSFPDDPGATNLVVAPHEFYPLSDATDRAIHRAAQLSVPICTEQPGTPWFDITRLVAAASPVALDINRHGVVALRSSGIDAHHLRLGGVPSMAVADDLGSRSQRPLDVLFLGGLTEHRSEVLADLAPVLRDVDHELRLFSSAAPVGPTAGTTVFGADKYDLLACSSVLLNVHRSASGGAAAEYFEWARMVEAMANGVVVLTEPVADFDPLVDGEHFVSTGDLGATLEQLLADPERCERIGRAAQRAVMGDLALEHSLRSALAEVEAAISGEGVGERPRRSPRYGSQIQRAQAVPLLPAFRPHREFRCRVHEAWGAEVALQRDIEATRCSLRHGRPDHEVHIESAAYRSARPRISVVVTLFDYADVVSETIGSVLASTEVDLASEVEVIVVDDHSRDDGRAVVTALLGEHPDVPSLVIGSEANRGLPASRNRGFEVARSDRVMVLDADNLVEPTCLATLAAALDADPSAAFAYGILVEFGARTGLQSALGWHVPWLCAANHIDAQAMVRRSAWERHGGYRSGDTGVFGWEDWEFWLRLAASGEHGVHVPELLGRYRTQASSMIATSNLFGDVMLDHLESLHPDLPWPSR